MESDSFRIPVAAMIMTISVLGFSEANAGAMKPRTGQWDLNRPNAPKKAPVKRNSKPPDERGTRDLPTAPRGRLTPWEMEQIQRALDRQSQAASRGRGLKRLPGSF